MSSNHKPIPAIDSEHYVEGARIVSYIFCNICRRFLHIVKSGNRKNFQRAYWRHNHKMIKLTQSQLERIEKIHKRWDSNEGR